ncbi:unnamed protein product [Caenorhabditis sp. 36 PRJEB53466]|nr:unnamed protein product [Caenorhabditis sp. 36 PRJEB53466]
MIHRLLFLVVSLVFSTVSSERIHIFVDINYNITVSKGYRIYFLSNGTESDLRACSVRAEKSQIDTNAFAYTVLQADGSVNPLLITADDDVLKIAKPEGNAAQINLYFNKINTPNLNVFPIFETSSVQFKSGLNVFFAIDKPSNKILTVKNLNLVRENTNLSAYTGVPGDANTYLFFDSSVYPKTKHYRQLDIPLYDFFFDQIDSGVTYEVSFSAESTNLEESGLIMTESFPLSQYAGDILRKVKSNGGGYTSLQIQTYFYGAISYNTDLIVYFENGLKQSASFSSGSGGRFNAEGFITYLEINFGGAYAFQYYLNESSTIPTSTTATYLETTTNSSNFTNLYLLLIVLFLVFTK